MRIGLIADIHGNLPALEAVLARMEHDELDRIVCLGDICFGPQASECLAIVSGLECPVVLGNWDCWSVDGFPAAEDPITAKLYEIGVFWARRLTEGDHAFVRTFQPTVALPLEEGLRGLFFHGSPRSFSDWIFATTPDDEVERLFSGHEASVYVGGHTHLQLLRRLGPSVVINPGSVGQPFSQWWPHQIRVAHWAEYAILDTATVGVGVEFRRVPFDLSRLLDLLAGSGMPHTGWWIDSWEASE